MYRQVERGNGPDGEPSLDPASTEPLLGFLELLPETARALPRTSTPLFDREADLERLCAMLAAPDIQLVTITGSGGVGKTRLALEAAHRSEWLFPDGVIAVSLAPIRDASQVLPALARSSGLRSSRATSIEAQLIAGLHEQRSLLVLDNFEHVIAAAPGIAHLLNACPHLTALVTSRAPLRLGMEHLFLATPLDVGTDGIDPNGRLPGALQLFAAHARQINPDFTLDQRNLDDVQGICRQLDGLPLAIELAAARIGAVAPRELLQRLEPSLSMLEFGNRDLPERQQTMRAAIAWSYALLTGREQRAFRWLSVFVGGFRLVTAESVISALNAEFGHPPLTDAELIGAVGSLVTNSLVHKSRDSGREYRFAMLEVVREYGLELLEREGELVAAQCAHAGWYASNREWLDPNRFSAGERFVDHLWDIEAEHPNILAALARCTVLRKSERVLEIAGNVAVYWHHRGYLAEGRKWLEDGLAGAEDAPVETRGWAFAGLALLCWTQGDTRDTESIAREALAIGETLDHVELCALALHILALLDLQRGHYERAQAHIEDALERWEALGLLSDVGMALHIRAWLPLRPGATDRRAADAKRAQEIFESIGHPSGTAFALHRLGYLALRSGQEHAALDYFTRSVQTWLSIDERWAIARPLVNIAELAMRHGRAREAGLMLGIVDHRLRASNANLTLESRQVFENVRARLAAQLDPDELQTLLRVGGALTPAEIESAIATLEPGSWIDRRFRRVSEKSCATSPTERPIARSPMRSSSAHARCKRMSVIF